MGAAVRADLRATAIATRGCSPRRPLVWRTRERPARQPVRVDRARRRLRRSAPAQPRRRAAVVPVRRQAHRRDDHVFVPLAMIGRSNPDRQRGVDPARRRRAHQERLRRGGAAPAGSSPAERDDGRCGRHGSAGLLWHSRRPAGARRSAPATWSSGPSRFYATARRSPARSGVPAAAHLRGAAAAPMRWQVLTPLFWHARETRGPVATPGARGPSTTTAPRGLEGGLPPLVFYGGTDAAATAWRRCCCSATSTDVRTRSGT